jgi:hypothetical protein
MTSGWPVAAATMILLAACAPHALSREGWQQMRSREKELYVRTLIGHEQVLTSKGGRGHRYSSAPSIYVRRIDDRYAAGDMRSVEEIWSELADGLSGSLSKMRKTAQTEVPMPLPHIRLP